MSDTKRQDLPGMLYVVATPIGNLGDLTSRARQALTESEVVYCEDTRRTAQLATALGISMRLERLDAHASEGRIEKAVSRLVDGGTAALVSDAGTPGVSDPGSAFVSRARALGVRIVPVPGPSAVAALLSVCGFPETAFSFRGFFPRKNAERIAEVKRAASTPGIRVSLWFESPERVIDALEAVALTSPEAEVVAGKELTKIHERFFCGDAPEVASAVRSEIEREGTRGEWCFACRFPAPAALGDGVEEPAAESANWGKALRLLLESGISVSEAAKKVSQTFDVSKKTVYAEALAAAERLSKGL